MPRESYQASLDDLQSDVLYMSELVIDRFRTGLDVLQTKNEAQARSVIEGDHEVNELYLELEGDCIDLLALQQPVATDLRFVAASFKIITDLERIGDLATNLADYALDAERDRYPEVDVGSIGDAVCEMIEDAMAAYADRDPGACRDVAARDDAIDERCEAASTAVVRDLIERETGGGSTATSAESMEPLLTDVSRLLLTVRDLERVGDHAVNIAARAYYMIENDDELIY